MRPLLLLAALLCGCAGQNGYIMTRDGRMVADTAETARDELGKLVAGRAAEAAGDGWKATAAIREQPVLDLVAAGEWGWPAMTIDLLAVPPAGSGDAAPAIARAEGAAREAARFRVRRAADVAVVTTIAAVGAPAPGSTRYTVVAGDTLAGISAAFYGTSQHWRLIADANPGTEVKPGAELVIPPKP